MQRLRQKKGFTLIELLAVIVILSVIMLVAGQNVFKILDDAERGTFRTEFLEFLNSAQIAAQMDVMNGVITASDHDKCYSYDDLSGGGTKEGYFDYKEGYEGSVLVDYQNGHFTITGWLSSSKYKIENKNESVTTKDVVDANATAASNTCAGKG